MAFLAVGVFACAIKPAVAHVGYIELTNGVPITNGGFNNYGWEDGTDPWLGDSHTLEGAAFYTFHLTQAEYVNISFASDSAVFDPAFSLYSGMLPNGGHDDTSTDPLGSGGLSISPTDAAPGDPGIAHYLWDSSTLSFVYNPQWTVPQPGLCDTASGCNLTPEQWYADNYTPHNGYRDILNYTATGGLDASGNPYHVYQGQFDALGNWSMANEDGEWSQINYITHVNNNATTLGTNGLAAGSYNTQTEYLQNLFLQPGDYTIAAGGAGCDYQIGQSAPLSCISSNMVGTLLFTASTSAVPIPASGWLMSSILAGVLAMQRRKHAGTHLTN